MSFFKIIKKKEITFTGAFFGGFYFYKEKKKNAFFKGRENTKFTGIIYNAFLAIKDTMDFFFWYR